MADLANIQLAQARTSSPGELIAHEVLGHGFNRTEGSANWDNKDAIQMGNLYRRVTKTTGYRNGSAHIAPPGIREKNQKRIVFDKTTANDIPAAIKEAIDFINAYKNNVVRKYPPNNDGTGKNKPNPVGQRKYWKVTQH